MDQKGKHMARVTRAASHLSAEEVKRRLKYDPRPWCRGRWLIISNATLRAQESGGDCQALWRVKGHGNPVISTYNRFGVEAIETPGKGGRRHQYLTVSEEKEFLAPFFTQAESGQIATVGQIQRAYEATVGHEVDESTIYRLLNRHGWRKLMPRPRHPQADLQEQEQFKKTLKPRLRRSSQPGQSKMNVLS
jgi:transposase